MLESSSRFLAEVAVLSEKREEFASEGLESGARPTLSRSFAKGSPSLILQVGDFFQGPVMLSEPRLGLTLGARWCTCPKASGKDVINGSTQARILLLCCDSLQN